MVIPQQLIDWTDTKQTGLVLLKIVEIIGEDNLVDLDPETLYFLSKKEWAMNSINLSSADNIIL